MASFDYFHCYICNGKAFYDATTDTGEAEVVALCKECKKTYEIVVRRKKSKRIKEKNNVL
jgi:transcription elongation factor Elf1